MKQEIRNKKIVKLEDFTAWQEAIKLAEQVYVLSNKFPSQEQYGLTSQLQRATVSVSANLAEGFGRQAPKDKELFYVMARGSLYEVKSLLELINRVGIATETSKVDNQLTKCLSLVGGLLRAHRINS